MGSMYFGQINFDYLFDYAVQAMNLKWGGINLIYLKI